MKIRVKPVIIRTSVGRSVRRPIITTIPTVPESRRPPAFSLPTRRSSRGASFISIVSMLGVADDRLAAGFTRATAGAFTGAESACFVVVRPALRSVSRRTPSPASA